MSCGYLLEVFSQFLLDGVVLDEQQLFEDRVDAAVGLLDALVPG